MKGSSAYLDFVAEQLAPLGEISIRRMFGGHCFYCEGVAFAIAHADVLYLKTDDLNRPMFLERGIEPFRPFADQSISVQYYPAPAETFESREGLEQWAGAAYQAGLRAASKKKQPKGSRPPTPRKSRAGR